METTYKKPLPHIHPETKEYWDATKRHELVMRRCRSCNEFYFYPRDFCPTCFSFDVEWKKVTGRGKLYSYTICHRPLEGFEEDGPYNIALVELEEGVRMMSTVVDCPQEDLKIGMALEVVFDDVTPEVTLPKFKPAG
jgi:uncharacterized protein